MTNRASRMVSLRMVVAALAGCVAFVGVSHADDKIVLVCSRTGSLFEGIPMPVKPGESADMMTLTIDLNRRTVTNSWVGFQESTITEATDSKINFEGANPKFGTWKGAIDRYSGAAWLSSRSGGGLFETIDMTCKPAKPLF